MKKEAYKLLKVISENRGIAGEKLEKLGFKYGGTEKASSRWSYDPNIVQLKAIKLIEEIGGSAYPGFHITLDGEKFLQQSENNSLIIRSAVTAAIVGAFIGSLFTTIGQIIISKEFSSDSACASSSGQKSTGVMKPQVAAQPTGAPDSSR
ncbi:MAG: hypothetical protein KCHDKBKB_02552 [Elusimicrobia bacterium]|nr:hypothetical protein [Elusimicrobiota bacterium]